VIEDRNRLAVSEAHETALECVAAGIEAGHPRTIVRDAVSLDGDTLRIADSTYNLDNYEEIVVLGGGNAAAHVAVALESILGGRIDRGVVITDDPVDTERVTVHEGDHPVPSERAVDGTRELLAVADAADKDTLVLATITGGGSALLPAPAGEVSLADLQSTTDGLLASGADIHEINAVRKHLSAIKGGHLARTLAPAQVSALVLSDVVGDDLDVIASGPLVADPTTYADALDVIESYALTIPESVREHLNAGAAGAIEETPGPDDPAFERVGTRLVGTNMTALAAARDEATERGYETLVLSSRIRGEASDAALAHVAVAEEVVETGNPVTPPAVVLSGGETTVTVDGDGRGGPNQEFALAAALELPSTAVLGAVDTDGVDGNTDAAGALVDGDVVGDTGAARRALDDNDANAYLGERGALLESGPTGTNVNDLRVLVVGSPE